MYKLNKSHSNKLIFFCLFFVFLMANCATEPVSYAEAIKKCSEKRAAQSGLLISPPICVIGTKFPILECTTVNDKKIDATYFKGKICIINCWFEGCLPCVAEIPGLNQLVHKYGTDKLQYLAISREGKEDVLKFLEQHEWNFDHVSDGKNIIQEDLKIPWGFPMTFLVDQKGVINKVITGGKSDSTAIEYVQHELAFKIDSLLSLE